MVDETLIESIVATYDLPSKKKKRILEIANINIDRFRIQGFDKIYEYIGHLVEKFKVPFGERVFVRFDDPITSYSENPFHHLFGAEDPNLVELLELPDEKMSVDEVVNMLEDVLSEFEFNLLQQLVNQKKEFKSHLLGTSPEKILGNVETIQNRLEQLAKKYEQNGEIIIPRRTIWYIWFNPLEIRYKRRLTQRDIEELVSLHKICNGNASEAARRMGCMDRTVRRHWKTRDLQAKGVRGDLLTKIQIDQINNAYVPSGGNSLMASKMIGYSVSSVLKYWRKEGFETRAGGGHIILPQTRIDEINAAYLTFNGNGLQASKALNISYSILLGNWQKVGLEPKGNLNSRRDQKKIDKIVSLHKLCNGNASEAARIVGMDSRTITVYWNEAELKAQGHRNKRKK